MSHLPLDARAILHYLNELGYRNISAEQLKEFLKGMQPQSNNSASRNNNQYNQQPGTTTRTTAAASATATSSSTVVSTNSLAQRRTPVKILKSKKPLCQFKFYLDICDHQLTKRIEDQIKVLGGVLEFFLNASVTHFITDKSPQPQASNNQPATPQTPATPGTPQTPYSLELTPTTTNDAATPLNNNATATKRTRTSRADAILNKARRQSQTATQRAPVAASAQATSSSLTQDSQLPYIVWQTEYALRFFKKVHIELRQYLEVPKERQKANTNNNNTTATPTSTNAYTCRTKFIEPISLKGNYIKIEPIKRHFRPYYQLFKKPIEWPRIDLKRDDGAFRLSPRKPNTEEPIQTATPQPKTEKPPLAADNNKMTRKSRSRSSQHRPLPASVQALKKQTLVESPKASAPAIQRTAAKDMLLTPNTKVETSDKQCGVCEICKIEYDTLSVHLKSKDHEFFAKNAQNFIALDTLINASADVNQFLADNGKKMELEEMEVVDEETNTEASAMDPLNNGTPTLGLMVEAGNGEQQKRRSSGAYKTPSPTLREKSKRITKGKHSSEKFQKTDYAASTMTATTTMTTGGLGTRSSPLKASRSPEKRQTSSILAEQAAAREESRKAAAAARKRTTPALPLSPPARPPMLPASPLYKVVETTEMRTPKRRIRMGAGGEESHLVDSPSLIVKFQKVRTTELERLNGEAESFMFRRHAANTSSELPTDQDRQTTSDVLRSGGARGSQSSLSIESTSDMEVDIERRADESTVLAPKAIAIAKRRKMATEKCRQSFPDAPIQPDIQLSTVTRTATTTTATTMLSSSSRRQPAVNATNFALPEATRKSSRTATAIVTAATTSSLLQAAVDAARLNSRRRRTAPASVEPLAATTTTTSRTRRTLVKLEDRMGDTPSNTSNKPSITPKIPNPKIKIKIERHTPIPTEPPAARLLPPELAAPPPARQSAKAAINRCASLELLSYAFIDDDDMEEDEEEDIDNDDLKDKDFKVRKRNRKPTMKAAAAARTAANAKRQRRAVTLAPCSSRLKAMASLINIKQEVLSEAEPEEQQKNAEERQQESEDDEADNNTETQEDGSQDKEQIDEEAERIRREKLAAKLKKRRRARLGSKPRKKKRQVPKKLLDNLKTEPLSSNATPQPMELDTKAANAEKAAAAKTTQLSSPRSASKRLTKDKANSTTSTPPSARSSPEKPQSAGKSRNKPATASRLFDYSKSEHIRSLQYSFERLPTADHWYRVFARQDAGQEQYHEYFGSTTYRKLPYELGPIPFDMTLNCVNCRLCNVGQQKAEKPDKLEAETDNKVKPTTTLKTEAAVAEEPEETKPKTSEESKEAERENAYLLKHKKLHLLQRYRQEQQELLQQHADKATQVDEEVKAEPEQLLNPATLNSTPALTHSTSTTTTLSSSKASTPDPENSSQSLGQRKRAGSTHSTASSCASSSATLNKKPFRNKHLNRASLLSLELPPRKSPREHASTLALVSCIIRQRQDSLSKNNSEVEDEPGTPTELQPSTIKKEEEEQETQKMNGDAAEEEAAELKLEAEAERKRKEQQELDEQAARVAQRERTPPPAPVPSIVEHHHHPALSPRTTRSTAATPIEEMRFATEISETVKRMRRGQNKYDHSPPFAEPTHRQQLSGTKSQTGGSTTKTPSRVGHTANATPSPAGSQSTTPRKRGRPPKDKCAAIAQLSMSILPYTRRGLGGMLHERSSSNRSNTPNSNRSSAMMLQRNSVATNSSSANSFKRRGRPGVLHKLAAYNSTHSNGYGLSPAVRKTGSKKGVIEYDVDMSALKALEINTKHTNVRHLEWEIDKYLQLACKDYGAEGLSLDNDTEATEEPAATLTEASLVEQPEIPPLVAQTPPPTDYFSSDFDLCDLLDNSAQIVGACAGMEQTDGKRIAYSVYSAVAFENYFKKRRSIKKNRTGWPNIQKKRVQGIRDQRKPHLRGSRCESKDSQKNEQRALENEELAEDAEKPEEKVEDNEEAEEEEEEENELMKASKSLRESEDDEEAGVITPPDSEAEEEDECEVEDAERLSAKTTASLQNAEDYEGAESIELDPPESVMQDDEVEDDIKEDQSKQELPEDHEVFVDAEGDAEPMLLPAEEEEEEDDAETMVGSIAETCTQDMAGIEADEEDALDDDDDDEEEEDDEEELEHADMVTINNDDNAHDDDDDEDEADEDRDEDDDEEECEENEAMQHDDPVDEDDDDAGTLRDELETCIDDNAQAAEGDREAYGELEPLEADDEEEETFVEAAAVENVYANGTLHEDDKEAEPMEVDVHDNEQKEAADDLEEEEEEEEEDEEVAKIAEVTANNHKLNNHNSFLAAFGGIHQKISPSTAAGSSSKRTRHHKTTTAPSTMSLNNSTTPLKSHISSSTPSNHHLLRALRRTPQLNGSLGSCISPTEKAVDSDIFTVSSDGLDTDLDLSNQHAQLRSGASHHDDEAANECPHHHSSSSTTTATTPRRKLDITKYAPKSSGSTCAAEAATAAVKSLAISQFLKKEVRVTCRRIRAPFRRFRFRR